MSNHDKFAFVQGLSSPFDCIWARMNMLLVIVLVIHMLIRSRHCWCVSTAYPEIVSWSYPQFYYVCLSSCLHRFNIYSCCECSHIVYVCIRRVYHVHTSIDAAWLNDWDPAKQRRTDTLFFDAAAVKPRVVAVLHHVEAEWLPCVQWSMSSDWLIVLVVLHGINR